MSKLVASGGKNLLLLLHVMDAMWSFVVSGGQKDRKKFRREKNAADELEALVDDLPIGCQ